ncbi:alpha-L-glutamate ligase [Streptomyces albus subsp. chlorinus]|uniref:ATP-grasp domain-containing protein n=1 Tax=Streptomyces albus TaxID=1888 RepID=UPI001570FA06|nr:alpha-L-glutamate ligase [Streptomyces albus]NSC22838.1 alpha-L-glutamate ligase [Streptomyces albus subsp. chlorinus]
MRVGLITPRPGHPLLAGATAVLSPRHTVTAIDPEAGDETALRARVLGGPLADVYLLKARTSRALALARAVEERGAPVVNSAAATAFCQDRTAMAERARQAGLPFARTRTVAALRALRALTARPAPECAFPFVVKSRHSRRGDLVARVEDAADLAALCATWADEPVVVQPFVANSGWDHKLWAIAGHVFAAPRRSELADASLGRSELADASLGRSEPAVVSAAPDPDPGPPPLDAHALPPGWAELVHAVGAVFSLDVYGVDVVVAEDGSPVIVDINAFPGLRGQSGAPRALAELVLRVGAGRRADGLRTGSRRADDHRADGQRADEGTGHGPGAVRAAPAAGSGGA